MYKFLLLAVALVTVQAIEYGHQEQHHEDYYTEPHYSFAYEVKDLHTHDIKSHKEERKGDHTQGVYELIEPDGSRRIVEYKVEGKSGFNAVVHREHSKHPIVQQHKGYGGESNGYIVGGDLSGHLGGGYSQGHASSYSSLNTKGSLGALGAASNGLGGNGYHQSLGYGSHGYGGNVGAQNLNYGGHGDATSSVKINTHGAHIAALTHHIIPQKHHY